MKRLLAIGLMMGGTSISQAAEMVPLLDHFPAFETRVVDAAGNPIAGIGGTVMHLGHFNKMYSFYGSPSSSLTLKKTGPDGVLRAPAVAANLAGPTGTEYSYSVILALSGEGYAPTIVTIPQGETLESVTLEPGIDVVIELEGKTVRGEPRVFPVGLDRTLAFSGGFIEMEKQGKNRWSVVLKEGDDYTISWEPKGGFLKKRPFFWGYLSERFTAKDELIVPIAPGEPATLEYEFPEPPDWLDPFPASVTLALSRGNTGAIEVCPRSVPRLNEPGSVRFEGIAPGNYFVYTRRSMNYNAGTERPYTTLARHSTPMPDVQEITLDSGETKRVTAVIPVKDESFEPGDVAFRGRVVDVDGQPVPGVRLNASTIDTGRKLPTGPYLTGRYYPTVTTDADGRFTFPGIDPKHGNRWDIHGETPQGGMVYRTVELKEIEGRDAIDLNLKFQPTVNLEKGSSLAHLRVHSPEGAEIALGNLKGKRVMIDLWATWCGPCREAMPKFQELARANGGGALAFLTVSLDNDADAWRRMLEKEGWSDARPMRMDTDASREKFSVGIPFYIALDEQGKIIEAGNSFDTVVAALGLKDAAGATAP